jgi:hypothetical protein
LYPAIFLLVWIWGIIDRIQNLASPTPSFALTLLHAFFAPCQGLLDAIAYGFTNNIVRNAAKRLICCRWRDLSHAIANGGLDNDDSSVSRADYLNDDSMTRGSSVAGGLGHGYGAGDIGALSRSSSAAAHLTTSPSGDWKSFKSSGTNTRAISALSGYHAAAALPVSSSNQNIGKGQLISSGVMIGPGVGFGGNGGTGVTIAAGIVSDHNRRLSSGSAHSLGSNGSSGVGVPPPANSFTSQASEYDRYTSNGSNQSQFQSAGGVQNGGRVTVAIGPRTTSSASSVSDMVPPTTPTALPPFKPSSLASSSSSSSSVPRASHHYHSHIHNNIVSPLSSSPPEPTNLITATSDGLMTVSSPSASPSTIVMKKDKRGESYGAHRQHGPRIDDDDDGDVARDT